MATAVENFKEKIVEGRYAVLVAAIVVLVMRFLLFYFRGVPEPLVIDTGFLWRFVAPLFSNPSISFGVSTLFVFWIALLIAGVNNRFSLIHTRTSLPFIVPLFILSLHPVFLMITPDLISTLLVVFALFPLLKAYQQTDTRLFSFRSSILIGIAGLFQIYALLLLPLWWRGEMSMRGRQPKSFLAFVFGFFLVYLSVFALYFLFDNVYGFYAPFLFFVHFLPLVIPLLSVVEWIGLALLFIYILLSMKWSGRAKKLTSSSINFMVSVVFFSMIFQVVYWHETKFFIFTGIALISYLIAYYHSRSASKIHVVLAFVVVTILAVFYSSNYLLP